MKYLCAWRVSGSMALRRTGFPESGLCHKIPRFQQIHAPNTAAIQRAMVTASPWGLAYLQTNHRRESR